MAQRVVPAIKLKEVVGEPTVAIQAALNDGSLIKNPNGKPASDQFLPLGYFVGRVTDQVEHKSKRQDPGGLGDGQSWPKLVGQFKAWSVDPARDTIVSHNAFLMDHITIHLGDTLREAHKDDPGASLEVLFEVGVTTSDKSSTGFTWTLRDMAEPTVQADPLAALVAKVQGAPLALSAPAAETGDQGDQGSESDEQGQAAHDTADAVSKDTGAGKVDHGGKGGRRHGR